VHNTRFCALPSLDVFLTAVLGDDNPASGAAFAADILREYDPDQPRDERGRWTTGASNISPTSATGPPGRIEQKHADAMVERLKKSPKGKELYEKAEKAANANGASGLSIKVEPASNLPPNTEAASDPRHGQIGIRNDVSDASLLEDIIVELANMARARELADLETRGITKMTRDQYIEAKEKLEFQSVQDTAKVWKAAAKECGQDASKCPTYGNPDDVLNLDFKTHFKRLTRQHKEFYGSQWDNANPRKR